MTPKAIRAIATTLIWLTVAYTVVRCAGCSQKIYERMTIKDPNGVTTYEHVHVGVTGIATDTDLDGLVFESGDRKIGLDRASERQDEFKLNIKEPKTGIELGVVTNE